MANTMLVLGYRDQSGWAASDVHVVLSGEMTSELLAKVERALFDGEFIVASQVGLPSPSDEMLEKFGLSEDDHALTSIEQFSKGETELLDFNTEAEPTVQLTVGQWVDQVVSAAASGWDFIKEMDRMGAVPRKSSAE